MHGVSSAENRQLGIRLADFGWVTKTLRDWGSRPVAFSIGYAFFDAGFAHIQHASSDDALH